MQYSQHLASDESEVPFDRLFLLGGSSLLGALGILLSVPDDILILFIKKLCNTSTRIQKGYPQGCLGAQKNFTPI